MKMLPTGDKLQQLANRHGIPTAGVGSADGIAPNRVSDAKLQERLLDFYAHRRGRWLWIVALASALASAASAAAAWIAVSRIPPP